MQYPVTLERDDNDTIRVSFPDFPEAHTFGDTREEAVARAQDALATVLDAYIKDRREIPRPTLRGRGVVVFVPALTAAKIGLYTLMRERRVGKAELARRLKWHMPQVDRVVDVRHASRLDQLETAFSALGKRIVVSVEDVEPRPVRQRHRESKPSKTGTSTARRPRARARISKSRRRS